MNHLCFKTAVVYLTMAIFCIEIANAQESRTMSEFSIATSVLWTHQLGASPRIAVAISTDETRCAIYCAEESEIRIFELDSGKVLRVVRINERNVFDVELEFTPDSTRLLFFNPRNETLQIIDSGSGVVLKTVIHKGGLYMPRFRQDKNRLRAKEVFCFSGNRTFTIVSVDLLSAEITPFFDLRDSLPETDFAENYGNVIYSFRDFMLDTKNLYAGLDGTAMAFDVADSKEIWKSKLSDADPVSFFCNPENPETAFAYCRTLPNITEIQLDGGDILSSMNSPSHFVVGQQKDVLLTLNHSGINRPTTLRAIKFNSDLVCEHEISKASFFRGFSCSASGRFLVLADSNGQVLCTKVLIKPDNATEQGDEPKSR